MFTQIPYTPFQFVLCNRWYSRLRGLLGKKYLAENICYVLYPCHAVHTITMAFEIDVIFCSQNGVVLDYVWRLRKGAVKACKGAYYVFELASRKRLTDVQIDLIVGDFFTAIYQD